MVIEYALGSECRYLDKDFIPRDWTMERTHCNSGRISRRRLSGPSAIALRDLFILQSGTLILFIYLFIKNK